MDTYWTHSNVEGGGDQWKLHDSLAPLVLATITWLPEARPRLYLPGGAASTHDNMEGVLATIREMYGSAVPAMDIDEVVIALEEVAATQEP